MDTTTAPFADDTPVVPANRLRAIHQILRENWEWMETFQEFFWTITGTPEEQTVASSVAYGWMAKTVDRLCPNIPTPVTYGTLKAAVETVNYAGVSPVDNWDACGRASQETHLFVSISGETVAAAEAYGAGVFITVSYDRHHGWVTVRENGAPKARATVNA